MVTKRRFLLTEPENCAILMKTREMGYPAGKEYNMRKEQKSELARIVLYSMCSLIVGCAVGGALLMKIVVEGKALPEHQQTAAESSAEEVPVPLPEALPAETVPEPEPVAEPLPPDADAVREMLKPAEPLFTQTYCYTDSDSYETHNEMFGKKVPFTTESVVLTYDGTICMGIDTAQIGYAVDPSQKQITVTLPQPELLSHDLDEDSIRYYDVKSSIFRSSSIADYTALIREIKQDVCKKVVNDRGFDRLTTENAETVIRSWLSGFEKTQDYKVVFAVSEAETEPADVQEEGTLPATEPSVTETTVTETETVTTTTETEPVYWFNPFTEPPQTEGGRQHDMPHDAPEGFTFWW